MKAIFKNFFCKRNFSEMFYKNIFKKFYVKNCNIFYLNFIKGIFLEFVISEQFSIETKFLNNFLEKFI